MNKKLTYIFMFILTFVCLGNIISKDMSLSLSERRPLESFPDLTIETVLDGDFMEDFEAYSLDQFMYRDTFKSLKTYYMIIPDKNYYVEDDQYRTIDYKALFEKINRSFHDYGNINASDLLTLEDYYKTDTQWQGTNNF